MTKDFIEWRKNNPWFGNKNKTKTREYLGIAEAIRLHTDLQGESFLLLVEKIWSKLNFQELVNSK